MIIKNEKSEPIKENLNLIQESSLISPSNTYECEYCFKAIRNEAFFDHLSNCERRKQEIKLKKEKIISPFQNEAQNQTSKHLLEATEYLNFNISSEGNENYLQSKIQNSKLNLGQDFQNNDSIFKIKNQEIKKSPVKKLLI